MNYVKKYVVLALKTQGRKAHSVSVVPVFGRETLQEKTGLRAAESPGSSWVTEGCHTQVIWQLGAAKRWRMLERSFGIFSCHMLSTACYGVCVNL